MSRIGGLILAVLVFVAVAFLALTDDDESPSYWQRWMHRATPQASSGKPVLHKTASFDLPGPAGKRFDYLAVVPDQHLLISTHLGAGRLCVIDTSKNKVTKTIGDLPRIQAVQVAPDLDKAYTSDWGEHKVDVIDLKKLELIKKLPVENKPDGIPYAAPFHKIHVSDERAKAEVVIDVTRDETVQTIRFDSEAGVPQYDPISRRVLVNLQEQNRIAEIDPATDNVLQSRPMSRQSRYSHRPGASAGISRARAQRPDDRVRS